MSSASFTTSTTGINLGPGVVHGLFVTGSASGARVHLYDAASTTGTPVFSIQMDGSNGSGYISLGGMEFATGCTVGATADYGGLTLIRQ